MRLPLLPLLVIFNMAAAGVLAWDWTERNPEDVPWTPLDLNAPIGWSTAAKLAALHDDPAACRQLLAEAGVAFDPPPNQRPPRPACMTSGAIRATRVGLTLSPYKHTLSCPMAAALLVWNRQVVIPAARLHLDSKAQSLVSMGSWNCRSVAGSARFSEHATANAIDIGGFNLGRGQRISFGADWDGDSRRRAFLREIRDGGCRLFRVVLSPDYNAAHANHLHLDMGPARACG